MTRIRAPALALSTAGGPGCHRSSHTVRPSVGRTQLEQADFRSGLEVPLLVEDAVVRQQSLAVDGLHGAVRAHEARVVEAAVLGVRRTDERDDARRGLRYLGQRRRLPRG